MLLAAGVGLVALGGLEGAAPSKAASARKGLVWQ